MYDLSRHEVERVMFHPEDEIANSFRPQGFYRGNSHSIACKLMNLEKRPYYLKDATMIARERLDSES